ncbi:unnamed protein product [Effrenium voratum]|nr:unnamed protein product [Effrenium voratum]
MAENYADLVSRILTVAQPTLYAFANGLQVDLEKMRPSKNKKALAVAVFGQMILNPICLNLVIQHWDVELIAKITATLIAIAPGGNTSNFLVWVSGGNLEISVLCTTATTILAIGVYPLWLKLAEVVFEMDTFEIPMIKILSGCSSMLVPLMAGMLTQYCCKISVKTTPWLRRCTNIMIVITIIMMLVVAVLQFSTPALRDSVVKGFLTCPALLTFMAASSATIGYMLAVIAQLPYLFRRTFMFELGIQNCALVSAIGAVSFSGEEFSLFIGIIGAFTCFSSYLLLFVGLYLRVLDWVCEPKGDAKPSDPALDEKPRQLTEDTGADSSTVSEASTQV